MPQPVSPSRLASTAGVTRPGPAPDQKCSETPSLPSRGSAPYASGSRAKTSAPVTISAPWRSSCRGRAGHQPHAAWDVPDSGAPTDPEYRKQMFCGDGFKAKGADQRVGSDHRVTWSLAMRSARRPWLARQRPPRGRRIPQCRGGPSRVRSGSDQGGPQPCRSQPAAPAERGHYSGAAPIAAARGSPVGPSRPERPGRGWGQGCMRKIAASTPERRGRRRAAATS